MSDEQPAAPETPAATTENQPEVTKGILDALTALTGQVQKLQESQVTIQQRFQPPQPAAPPKPALTDEQRQALVKDPEAAARYIDTMIQQGTKTIEMTAQKASMDNRTYETYPTLRTNQDFQQKVLSKMNELMSTDGYTREHPNLLWRATELVAGTMGQQPGAGKPSPLTTTTARATSAELTPGTRQNPKSKIGEDDERVKFLRLMEPNFDEKKVDKFKSELGPYVEPTRKQGRIVNRGR